QRVDAAARRGIVLGVGREQARDEALAQQSAMAVTADRIEAEPDERTPADAPVGDYGDRARGHRIEADARVAHRRRERHPGFADRRDLHARLDPGRAADLT